VTGIADVLDAVQGTVLFRTGVPLRVRYPRRVENTGKAIWSMTVVMEVSVGIAFTHKLLTELWRADVHAVEMGIRRFSASDAVTNDCRVVLFEVVRDDHLHVNVTHKYRTSTPRGWAGPASMPRGFVHNRTFAGGHRNHIVEHIRDMIFATPN